MYPVKQAPYRSHSRAGGGVKGTGQVQGGGAVDEPPVGLSKGGLAKGRKNTEQQFSSFTS